MVFALKLPTRDNYSAGALIYGSYLVEEEGPTLRRCGADCFGYKPGGMIHTQGRMGSTAPIAAGPYFRFSYVH